MNDQDHINLIKNALPRENGTWADLGSGDGAFTLALADLLPASEIYSIDKNSLRLENQKLEFVHRFPNANIHFISADFNKPLKLPLLDGILMANSLHYVKEQT